MTEGDLRSAIGALRCAGCHRAPTADEEREMFRSFGAALLKDPLGANEVLIWRCLACVK
jgi:hypothetical protein